MPAWLTSFRTSRPATAVSLTTVNSATVAELVLNQQAELGFVESPRLPAGLNARTVGTDTLLLVTAASSPLTRRRRRAFTADELAGLPLVEREAGSGTRAWLDAVLARTTDALPRPTPLLEVSSTTALRAAVRPARGRPSSRVSPSAKTSRPARSWRSLSPASTSGARSGRSGGAEPPSWTPDATCSPSPRVSRPPSGDQGHSHAHQDPKLEAGPRRSVHEPRGRHGGREQEGSAACSVDISIEERGSSGGCRYAEEVPAGVQT